MSSSPTRNDIRRVVVLLAGSRTGSSYLFRALNRTARFLAPSGEETPFLRLAGLGNFDGPSYSDVIEAIPPFQVLEKAGRLLLSDVGAWTGLCEDPGRLARDFLARVAIQWPDCIPADRQASIREALLAKLMALPEAFQDWKACYSGWIEELGNQGLSVNSSLLSARGAHPASLPLFEEPPYIAPEPKSPLTRKLASEVPLLLKTSTNLYRIPLLRALFPHAEFKWILLQRNPAASISALIDGWLSSAFHSHDVSPHVLLKIGGYSDRVLGGERYWKFDMPPGWVAYAGSSLAEVCAFQWYSAHQVVENFGRYSADPVFRLRYEDLLDPTLREERLRELVSFSGSSPRDNAPRADEPVMSVDVPLPGKWRKRADQVSTLLRNFDQGAILKLAGQLDYDFGKVDSWP